MVKHLILGYLLGLFCFVACGAVTYRYYGLEMPSPCYDQGILLGPKPSDDLPLSTCKPDAGRKGKCVVMESSEHFAARTELLQCRERLKLCEAGSRP